MCNCEKLICLKLLYIFLLLFHPTPKIQVMVRNPANQFWTIWLSTFTLYLLVYWYIPIVVLEFSSKVFLELTLKTDLGFPLKLQQLDIQIVLHLNQSCVTWQLILFFIIEFSTCSKIFLSVYSLILPDSTCPVFCQFKFLIWSS